MSDQVNRYREVRETIERGTLPLATSVDGRTFELQASLHGLQLRRGGYVALECGAGTRLGQVTDILLRSVTADVEGVPGSRSSILVRLAVGNGLLLSPGEPFHDARVRPAEPDEVATWLAATRTGRAVLDIGEMLLSPGVPAELDSAGLTRHTFMCGQSGSGKTYSLGVLLERILAETSLRIVVLDPNSDYVGLGQVRPDAEPVLGACYRSVAADVAVWGAEAADHRLRLKFEELEPRTQAAVLGLDPLLDAEEYSALTQLLGTRKGGQPVVAGLSELLESPSAGTRQLGMRASNLGVLDWAVWSRTEPSIVQELSAPTSRCVVVDLGSLATVQEQSLVADAVLATLWERRLSRDPVLVVIDEAHNVCASNPGGALSRLSADRAVQIAAEGRKFGLYLLASTQRPNKVHENVVSQCDNLLLMRMNAASDLRELERLFSFVPPGLVAGATTFAMGHMLVSGRIFPPGAGYVRVGDRVSHEGGADVPITWSRPRRP